MAISVVYLGPNQIADIISGINVKSITNNCVFIDINRFSTISNASRIPDKITFFNFDIKKFPLKMYFSAHLKKKNVCNYSFS